jgi:hypothetical protein
VEHEFFDPTRRRDDEIDGLEGDVALGHPGGGVGDEPRERRGAFDAAAHRVMHLGLTGE